jgi:hypothetical protein
VIQYEPTRHPTGYSLPNATEDFSNRRDNQGAEGRSGNEAKNPYHPRLHASVY